MGHLRIVGSDSEEYAYVTACRRRIAKSSYSGKTLATADEQYQGIAKEITERMFSSFPYDINSFKSEGILS